MQICSRFLLYLFFVSFFFFKQKTAYEMRISDWSSDVCSSDLPREIPIGARVRARFKEHALGRLRRGARPEAHPRQLDLLADIIFGHQEIDGADARAVLDDEIHRRLSGRLAANRRALGQRLAGERIQRLILKPRPYPLFGSPPATKIFPHP